MRAWEKGGVLEHELKQGRKATAETFAATGTLATSGNTRNIKDPATSRTAITPAESWKPAPAMMQGISRNDSNTIDTRNRRDAN